ncbi:WD40 repeat domain-containing protein [Nocardiopsis composta]|uniref:Dipeptidyl aminopeptidase/acylaminoacyl peptidase n=1 Tax=Nocardiopsis composta TaxID=157465 RepID=A0A7W8QHN5_9ACTN|nr:PD40 domain-containing protein [Nocardiopsis composta]MBB5430399.1 dipeptidyl aminopeptidase/acylaminoacyl peptidase [Nocardiopsis composta]
MSEHPRHPLTRPVCIAATAALTLTAAAAPAAADPAGGQPPAGTLIAFDTGEETYDAAVTVIDPQGRVQTETGGLGVQISGMRMSPDGARIALQGFSGPAPRAYLLPVDTGAPAQIPMEYGGLQWQPDWSPDGTRVAFVVEDPCMKICPVVEDGVHTYTVGDEHSRRLLDARDIPDHTAVLWDPREEWIASYPRDTVSSPRIDLLDQETGETVRTVALDGRIFHAQWTPDGSRLLIGTVDGRDGGQTTRAWTLDRDSAEPQEAFSLPGFVPFDWSPDGEWIVRHGPGEQEEYGVHIAPAGDAGDSRLIHETADPPRHLTW